MGRRARGDPSMMIEDGVGGPWALGSAGCLPRTTTVASPEVVSPGRWRAGVWSGRLLPARPRPPEARPDVAPRSSRLTCLDGLRGLATLSTVLLHLRFGQITFHPWI